MFAAIATASAAFAAPMLIPAPREMSVTGGRVALAAAAAPRWGRPSTESYSTPHAVCTRRG